jgi:ACS family hexuronate transporter-like MFS transporter
MRPAGYYRWVVCGLLFFAATINYIDRQVLGLLKPMLQSELNWNEIDYSNIVVAFQLAFAAGFLLSGRIIDWLGAARGLSASVFLWSIAAMAHALARSVFGFSVARFALGLGESGNFPAALKAIAEWFPKRERALAAGLMMAGNNVGALVAPIMVPWLTHSYGWRGAFIATGAIGFIWLVFWIPMYGPPDEHRRVTAAELAYIRSDASEDPTPMGWRQLVRYRQTWAFAISKFLTDPIWWMYLYWVPDFLSRNHGLKLEGMVAPLLIIYIGADVGSVCGGWFSSALIKRGWSLNAARKTAMLICAIAVTPIVFASHTTSLWTAVGLLTLATAAHQGWMANVFTVPSDTFPRHVVASVVGIGGMAGAIGGMLIAKVVGYVLQFTGSYVPVFFIAGCVYLVALGIIQLLMPTIEPARIEAAR